MYTNVVDRLHGEFADLRDFLKASNGDEFLSTVEGYLPRTMLLAVASYFEGRLSEEVQRLAAEQAGDRHVLTWLVRNKVVRRQYHTWFSWDARNVNTFLSMFGQEFKDEAAKWIAEDGNLRRAVMDFLEIGRERNRLVHENFGDAPLELTTADVYSLYESASAFVDWFPQAIRRYLGEMAAVTGPAQE